MDSEENSTAEEQTDLMESGTASAADRLRIAREAKRLELSHIAAETRIPIRHLEAIERGEFDALPSRAYAIGFSKSYARSVGLNEQEIAEAVREELADGYTRQSAVAGGMEPGDPAKLPSSGLAWFAGFAALALIVGVVAFASTYFGAGTGPASLIAGIGDPDNPDGSEAIAANENGTESGAGSAAAAAVSGGQVIFTALEDGVWVRFSEDGGERLFEGVMASGDTFELPADAVEPRINTGRPYALAITIGGTSVPKLSEEAIVLGDTPVSATALLARANTPAGIPVASN